MKKKMTRREFLKGGLSLGLYSACSLAAHGRLGNQLVYAQSCNGTGKRIVFVNLFGGADLQMSMLVPFNIGDYYSRRGSLAIDGGDTVALNGTSGSDAIGLYNQASDLHSFFQNNEMAIVQQVGYPNPDRSHFASQDIWSMGLRNFDNADTRGWLGRLMDLHDFSQIAVGTLGARRDFNNNAGKATVIQNAASMKMSIDWTGGEDNVLQDQVLQAHHFRDQSSTHPNAQKATEAMRNMYNLIPSFQGAEAAYSSTITYPEFQLGNDFKEVSKLIQYASAFSQTQVFYTGLSGWDTHANQQGTFNTLLSGTAASLKAFIDDLKAMNEYDNTVIIVFSEFGRNCFINGSAGTDHGHGNAMLLFGGKVNGGIYGPSLSASDMNQDYLTNQIDFRKVFEAVVEHHLCLDPGPVFTETITEGNVDMSGLIQA